MSQGDAYAKPGELICGDPYPLGGKPCQRPPDHDPEPHARPVSGGFDAWTKLDESDTE